MKLFDDGRQLQYIMFNFPHTGLGIKDQDRNIKRHQELMVAFFQNCSRVFDLVNVGNKSIMILGVTTMTMIKMGEF